jgi:hypothetical protein
MCIYANVYMFMYICTGATFPSLGVTNRPQSADTYESSSGKRSATHINGCLSIRR